MEYTGHALTVIVAMAVVSALAYSALYILYSTNLTGAAGVSAGQPLVARFYGYSPQSFIIVNTYGELNKSFTISFWMYPERVGNGVNGSGYSEDVVDVYNNTPTGLPQTYLEWRGNGMFDINFCRFHRLGSVDCSEEYNYERWTDEWVYITEVYDNGTFAVYADGKPIYGSAGLADSRNSTWGPAVNNIVITNPVIYISTFESYAPYQMDNPFDGYISDVQIYKDMLNPAQIQELYNESLTGKPLANANLFGWWPLDGNANGSYGGYNGHIYGNVTFVPAPRQGT